MCVDVQRRRFVKAVNVAYVETTIVTLIIEKMMTLLALAMDIYVEVAIRRREQELRRRKKIGRLEKRRNENRSNERLVNVLLPPQRMAAVLLPKSSCLGNSETPFFW